MEFFLEIPVNPGFLLLPYRRSCTLTYVFSSDFQSIWAVDFPTVENNYIHRFYPVFQIGVKRKFIIIITSSTCAIYTNLMKSPHRHKAIRQYYKPFDDPGKAKWSRADHGQSPWKGKKILFMELSSSLYRYVSAIKVFFQSINQSLTHRNFVSPIFLSCPLATTSCKVFLLECDSWINGTGNFRPKASRFLRCDKSVGMLNLFYPMVSMMAPSIICKLSEILEKKKKKNGKPNF